LLFLYVTDQDNSSQPNALPRARYDIVIPRGKLVKTGLFCHTHVTTSS